MKYVNAYVVFKEESAANNALKWYVFFNYHIKIVLIIKYYL